MVGVPVSRGGALVARGSLVQGHLVQGPLVASLGVGDETDDVRHRLPFRAVELVEGALLEVAGARDDCEAGAVGAAHEGAGDVGAGVPRCDAAGGGRAGVDGARGEDEEEEGDDEHDGRREFGEHDDNG